MDVFKKSTELDKEILNPAIKEGCTVVDATCGNGHDTLFLARKVGHEGKVYSFDIQDTAILNTEELLRKEDLRSRVKLLKEDHARMFEFVPEKVSAVMFNLGYLPGSDKSIITKPDTTVKAMNSGLNLLKIEGIITCVIYQGHEEGSQEAREVEKFCQELSPQYYNVVKINSANLRKPPYLIVIKKIKGEE